MKIGQIRVKIVLSISGINSLLRLEKFQLMTIMLVQWSGKHHIVLPPYVRPWSQRNTKKSCSSFPGLSNELPGFSKTLQGRNRIKGLFHDVANYVI